MIRRSGNFGFIDNGNGELISFNLNAGSRLSSAGTAALDMRFAAYAGGLKYRIVNGVKTIPYGDDDDLPGYVDRVLSNFYAGEGIMGKKTGLQWGEGPRLYRDEVDADNKPFRAWAVEPQVSASLDDIDYLTQMQRCLVDLVHLEGFWVKITRTRAPRIGAPGAIARIEHVPAARVRFVYEGEGVAPRRAVVGDFPHPLVQDFTEYPLFNPADPFRHPVALAYFSLYSYNKQHYSVPRFVGAFGWLELAGTLPGILAAYNENASAVSMHIESPAGYWEDAEKRLQDICERTGVQYSAQMLEQLKDEAMEKFAASMTGRKNAGKFMHTSAFFNEAAGDYQGWKITPIDKKIKDYIEAQVAVARKADSAATSGFGLDPALSNLILDTKLGSGSEKLYSLKVYNATETALPDLVLCRPWQIFIDNNFPGSRLRIGLYRAIVDAEKNINPANRIKANA